MLRALATATLSLALACKPSEPRQAPAGSAAPSAPRDAPAVDATAPADAVLADAPADAWVPDAAVGARQGTVCATSHGEHVRDCAAGLVCCHPGGYQGLAWTCETKKRCLELGQRP